MQHVKEQEEQLAEMRVAMSDQQFVADLNETMEAFRDVDNDEKAAWVLGEFEIV